MHDDSLGCDVHDSQSWFYVFVMRASHPKLRKINESYRIHLLFRDYTVVL